MTEPLPADDLDRVPTGAAIQDLARPGGVRGYSPYTVLVSGAQTSGRYCLLELVVPPGGGPRGHRHDFEELFVLLEGEIEFTVRGVPQVVRAPHVLNVPANAPHRFLNRSGKPAHMLCMCTPAGLEEFFEKLGELNGAELATSPLANETAEERRRILRRELALQYRMEVSEG